MTGARATGGALKSRPWLPSPGFHFQELGPEVALLTGPQSQIQGLVHQEQHLAPLPGPQFPFP